jgi:hypothetical protein
MVNMNQINLVPTDPLTKRLLVEVLAAMYKYDLTINKAAATSEFPRPDAATADMQSAQTDVQSNSTTVPVSGQNELKIAETVGLTVAMS